MRILLNTIIVLILAVGTFLTTSIGSAADIPKPIPCLGINLNGPADWNTELPFVDVFRLSRKWVSQRKNASWGKGPDLSLDQHGWVKKLEPDCWAESPLCTIDGGHYPSGEYTVLYDGKGKLEFWGAASIVSSTPGKIIIKVDSAKGGFFLRIMETDPESYVRNIRVVMPGFIDTFQKNPWNPSLLKRWKGMKCLRFMDWMHTNGSKISMWSERPQPGDATFTGKGIPLELMIDISNRLKADPWFCMPHLADDDYIRNFAMMVKQQLDPGLKIYVEYSNEIWNGMFEQSKWAGNQGIKLGFAEKPWEAAWNFTAYRSVQIFKIWEDVFGGTKRLIRILPTQAANPYVSKRIMEFQDAYKHADALTIAPYISFNVPAQSDKLNAETVSKWTVDQALDHMENKSLPESIKWIQDQKKAAEEKGLKLIAYEAGQHMVGVGGGENNAVMTKLFHEANIHPRMGEIYNKYFDAWTEAGGDLLCYFSSVGSWSKWGSWGVMQYADEDPSKSPKYTSAIRWARKCGQATGQ